MVPAGTIHGMYSRHRINIIGAPSGLGGRTRGAGLGPAALRLAGLVEQLEPIVAETMDGGDVTRGSSQALNRGPGIGYFENILGNLIELKEAVNSAILPGAIPLVLGGDHSIAIATISAALESTDEPLGVLWIDAHADLNTPDTSPSANLHGMVLGALCGFPCGECDAPMQEQWSRLLAEVVPQQRLSLSQVALLGLRDLDPGEKARILDQHHRHAISMHEVDRYGVSAMVEHALQTLRLAGVRRLWISFDADVLDPVVASGTGTIVRGGLSYREAHMVAELLYEALRAEGAPFELIGAEIVEVNPILDRRNETAVTCVEWVASLLGKRILPAWC